MQIERHRVELAFHGALHIQGEHTKGRDHLAGHKRGGADLAVVGELADPARHRHATCDKTLHQGAIAVADIGLIQTDPLLLQQGHGLVKTGLGGKTAGNHRLERKTLQLTWAQPAMQAMLFEQGDGLRLSNNGKVEIERFIFEQHLEGPLVSGQPETQLIGHPAGARAHIHALACQQKTPHRLSWLQLSDHGRCSPASGLSVYINSIYTHLAPCQQDHASRLP